MENQKVEFQNLGMISYKESWEYQQKLHNELVRQKREHAKLDIKRGPEKHFLLMCQHKPVYTLGKSGSEANLKIDKKGLEKEQIDYFKINRGGDITFHGPGQLVVYPIFDLNCFFTDVHKYVRTLEQIVIDSLAQFQVPAKRIKEYTGVWVEKKKGEQDRKICAIGVHLSRWVTMHGFALNVNTDLNYFNHIVPCGIIDDAKTVTSMSQELGKTIDFDQVIPLIKIGFQKEFGFTFL